MISTVVKRSVNIGGHNTSVSLEDAFWGGLKEIAALQHVTVSQLLSSIEHQRQQPNLSSAVRVFVLHTFQRQAAESQARQNEHVEF
jgi:predicted DNA-binding ribbon-helix-helix protein